MKRLAFTLAALAALPGAATAATQTTGILAAPFRMVPDQPIQVVVDAPAPQLPAGARIFAMTVPLPADHQERQSWLSKLAVAGGAAPAFSTCIVVLILPNGHTVKATSGDCLGTLTSAGPLRFDVADTNTVAAGNKVGVVLTPQAAALLPR